MTCCCILSSIDHLSLYVTRYADEERPVGKRWKIRSRYIATATASPVHPPGRRQALRAERMRHRPEEVRLSKRWYRAGQADGRGNGLGIDQISWTTSREAVSGPSLSPARSKQTRPCSQRWRAHARPTRGGVATVDALVPTAHKSLYQTVSPGIVMYSQSRQSVRPSVPHQAGVESCLVLS